MDESRIELTDRLRREGRWPEASRFKDTALKEFRSKGMKRGEAAEAAWAAMAAAFPPLPPAEQPPTPLPAVQPPVEPIAKAPDPKPSEPPPPAASRRGQNGLGVFGAPPVPEEDIDIDALLERVGDRQPPDLVRDTLWAYENLSNRKAKPEDAPSLGAWSLLQWARQYRNRFFEMVLPKAMAARSGEDEEQIRKEKKSIAEIEAVLQKMLDVEDAKLADDVPRAIRERVHGVLTDWSHRFGLVLPDGASTSLEAHVAELVDHCVKVLAPASGAA